MLAVNAIGVDQNFQDAGNGGLGVQASNIKVLMGIPACKKRKYIILHSAEHLYNRLISFATQEAVNG